MMPVVIADYEPVISSESDWHPKAYRKSWAGDPALDNVVVTKIEIVPEPVAMILLGLGLVGVAGVKRKFNN
jgi:hypothetical protein